jgi:hypothetical protein
MEKNRLNISPKLCLIGLLFLANFGLCAQILESPDKNISVRFQFQAGRCYYSVFFQNKVVLESSTLGLTRSDADFSKNLNLIEFKKIGKIEDRYEIKNAKKSKVHYVANKYQVCLKNSQNQKIDIIFQVSNDGLAFRYFFPESHTKEVQITEEITSFNFKNDALAWLQPMSDAQTGWEHCHPSYEEFYEKEIPVGTPSPIKAGWVYPALFKTDKNTFVAISEAGLDGTYCGTRLKAESPQGNYQVGFPQSPEVFTNGVLLPTSKLPWLSPWRIIAVGSLKTIVESTLGIDLALPQIPLKTVDWIKPGISSWSWIMLKDQSINYDTTQMYIDYAAKMHWQYCLIDVNWDTNIGYDRMKELADYANNKNVKLILWYNSAGAWNTTPYHPRNLLLTAESRKKELQRIKDMGIAGVKIDFFAGDGQSMIQYYLDILKDTGEIGLLVNFHGATLPRGWHRTYPHLMTAEAIKGFEMVTFGQDAANEQPKHSATMPFTRNLFDPMDFTPMVLDSIPNIKRITSKGFELALPILFQSGIQHLAESPDGMAKQPKEIIEYLQALPTFWDETRFIDGYPGKFVVLARRSASKWYLCGINAENVEKNLTLDLSFLNAKIGLSFQDVATNQVLQKTINPTAQTRIKLLPNGGFVSVF